jgi:hypothetical protein
VAVLRTAIGREVDKGDDRWGLGVSEREGEGGARVSRAKRWVAAAATLAGLAHAGREGEGEE